MNPLIQWAEKLRAWFAAPPNLLNRTLILLKSRAPAAPPAQTAPLSTSPVAPPAPVASPMAKQEKTMSELSDALKNGLATLKNVLEGLEPQAKATVATAVAQLEPAVTAAVPVLDSEAATAAAAVPTVGPLLAAAITAGEPTFLAGAKNLVAYLTPLIANLEATAEADLAKL